MKHYILKNLAIWLAESILTHNLRTRILPDMGLVVKYYNIRFHFRLFLGKTKDTIFQKIQKTLFWGPFSALFSQILAKIIFPGKFFQIFPKKSVFNYSSYLPPCKKSEKVSEPFLRKILNEQMDGQMDRQTDRQRWFYTTIHLMRVQKIEVINCKRGFTNWREYYFIRTLPHFKQQCTIKMHLMRDPKVDVLDSFLVKIPCQRRNSCIYRNPISSRSW